MEQGNNVPCRNEGLCFSSTQLATVRTHPSLPPATCCSISVCPRPAIIPTESLSPIIPTLSRCFRRVLETGPWGEKSRINMEGCLLGEKMDERGGGGCYKREAFYPFDTPDFVS